MSKTPTPEEAARPKKQLRALSTKLGAMADIEAIMNGLAVKDRPGVVAWFVQEYASEPPRDSAERGS